MESTTFVLAPQGLLVLAPIVAAVAVLVRSRAASRRAALDRFARRVELDTPGTSRSRAERLLWVRNVSTALGAAAGVMLVAAVAWATRSELVAGTLWPLVFVGAAFTGAAVGAGASAARQARLRPDEGGRRIARPAAAGLDDYIPPVELVGGRIAALLPTLVLLAATVAGVVLEPVRTASVLTLGLLAAALVSLGALVGSEVAGRRLIELPQAAGSDLELAWNDAVRARVLRDLVTVPIAVGTYSTLGVLVTLGGAIDHDTLGSAVHAAAGLAALTTVVLAVVSSVARPHRHFRRRLWPTLSADAATGRGAR